MAMEKRDVVIVGGGLAGLTTAKYLAEEGVDFVLLEEHTKFFQKPCGEGILPSYIDFDFFDLYGSKKGVEREINEVVFIIKDKALTVPIHFFMIDKEEVEKEMAHQVEKLGGEIRMGEKVQKIKDNVVYPQEISARIIVGADGARSLVRKSMGIKSPKIGVAIEGHVDHMEGFDESKAYIWFGKSITVEGYAWAFPRKEFWNVGIGSAKTEGFSTYANRFKSRFEMKDVRGAAIPFSLPVKTYGKNFLLVGDAASQVMTAVGAGNLPSMVCGKLAAETISRCLKSGSINLHLYENAWKKHLKKLFRQSYTIYRMASFLSYREENRAYRWVKLLMKMFAGSPKESDIKST